MVETSPAVDLAGPRKAAILFVLLGEDTAVKLLKHLSHDQLSKVAREIAGLGAIEPVLATRVLQDYFVDATRPEREQGGPDIARRILSRVEVTPEQLDGMLGRPKDRPSKALEPVLEAEPGVLARALAEEHPQTSALILLNLPPARAARVLSALPESVRSETVLRMATMRRVRGDLLGDVATSLKERLSAALPEESEAGETDGIERTASVLSSLGRGATRRLLETLELQDPERAAALKDLVFTFESLLAADDRGIQELLRQIETKTLALALHGDTEGILQRITKNLSERAAGILKDEIDFLSGVRPDEKRAAQNEIVSAALKLEDEGRLSFAEPEGGDGNA